MTQKSGDCFVCGHCGYEGPCYGNGYSAPWCYKCQMNNKLTKVEVEEHTG